jgi:hypothetical protein
MFGNENRIVRGDADVQRFVTGLLCWICTKQLRRLTWERKEKRRQIQMLVSKTPLPPGDLAGPGSMQRERRPVKAKMHWTRNIQAFVAHDRTVSLITIQHILLNHNWDPGSDLIAVKVHTGLCKELVAWRS